MLKQLIIGLSIGLFSLTSFAQVEEWTILSTNKDPKEVIAYTVIPSTAQLVQTNSGPETWVVVEIFQMADVSTLTRRRVRVTGCTAGTGKVTLANMDGSFIKENPVWEWDQSGNKIYDMVAMQACVSEFVKSKQPEMKKQSSQGPTV
jgi:hypothetical protein